MVMFPDGAMSDGNESNQPSLSTRDAPKFKLRKVSANRQFPPMRGLEYQHFSAEPEETAAVPGGENVALNLDSNSGAVTGSGFQNQSDGAGTSIGLEVQEKSGVQFRDTVEKSHEANDVQILSFEAWESHFAVETDTSEKLMNSGGWDDMFDVDAISAIDLDTFDFQMESGEILASPVEEEGNEPVDMMVEITDEKPYSECGFVIHEEGSPPRSKKTLPIRKVSVKRDFPKYCGLNATAPPAEEDQNVVIAPPAEEDQKVVIAPHAEEEHNVVIAPPAEEDQNVGIESMDARAGDNVVASSIEEDQETVNVLVAEKYCPWRHPTKVTAVSGGSKAVGSASPVKPAWRGKSVARKITSSAQRLIVKNMAASSEDDDSEEEAPCKEGKRSSMSNVGVLNSGPSSSNVDVRSEVRDVLRTYQTECRKLLHGEEARLEGVKAKQKFRRIDLEAVKILRSRGKVVNTQPHHFIGSVPGIEVGDEFTYRAELAIVGIHRSYQGGIDFTTHENGDKIAVSVVASGGYEDDLGDPNVLIYSGQGGNPGRGKEAEDQKLRRGNLALWNSKRLKNPVRVVRGTKENDQDSKSKIVTKYVYDGLYTVEDQWKETGEHGKLVYMFKLIRKPNQPEVAWKECKASKRTAWVRHSACIEDITQKKELFPIGVVNTIDDEKPPAFTYIEKVRYPKSFNLQPGKGCSCPGKCSDSQKCSCASKNGGGIPYNRNGSLVETKTMVYECGPHCKCPPSCYNRVSQSGIKLPLEVFKTDGRGWGVRALSSIPSGSFICEYTGEILNQEDAGRRTNDEYLFDLGPKKSSDSESESESDAETGERYTIDALRLGNVGRFINHSCSPNVYAQNVIYDHDDKKMPHIMLFATENIPPLQELMYNYNYTVGQVHDTNGNQKIKECRCGAASCKGRLY